MKILLLKSHVNLEGQGRLTEMTLDRITLMAIWGTEQGAWIMERQQPEAQLGVTIVFRKKQEKNVFLGRNALLVQSNFRDMVVVVMIWRATESQLV